MTPETLAIIPARGGSKGLPRKNILHLNGLPLIAYSIKSALAAERITRVVVSTDDEEIADIATYYGAEVPTLRSNRYAGDKACVDDVIRHTLDTLKQIEGYMPKYLAALYPTSPLRHKGLLDDLVSKLHEGYSPVGTYKRVMTHVKSLFFLSENGQMQPFTTGNQKNGTAKPYYKSYGVFTGRCISHTQLPYMYLIKKTANLLDIDTREDLEAAERLLQQNDFDFGW